MSFLNGKLIEELVVPVECCNEQGTAFFIGERQLLTARHVVRGHFCDPNSPDPIYITIGGAKYLCKAKSISTKKEIVDVALLTINDDEKIVSKNHLLLLKDEFVPDLKLRVYGYPQEVAMGINLVELDVENRLEIKEWNSRALIRRDQLKLHSYDGLSGSPVANIEGRVVGILTQQTNETLSYLSVADMCNQLDSAGITYDEDWPSEDITTFGQGRSTEICKKTIATIRERYLEKLHQPNNQLEDLLDWFSDKKSIDEKQKNLKELTKFLEGLPEEKLERISKILSPHEITKDLELFCRYAMADRFKSVLSWNKEIELNKLVRNLYNDHAFDYILFSEIKNLCFIGKAGSGKTHSLCEFASKKQHQANIYLFLGTEFVLHVSAIDQIKNKVCEEKSFHDFDIELGKRGRYAVIVIDALNEGLGCGFWNNQLGSLREELNNYSNFKLVVSVRNPFDRELNDLTANWKIVTVKGFENKIEAINRFFTEYKIPDNYRYKHLEAFSNPLFLRIFCETYHSLSKSEPDILSRLTIYKQYVRNKNITISKQIDEDVELNIADRYLMKLANYSVHHNHFNAISRSKAREFASRICPYRLWSQDLLNATLSASLLLDDHSVEEGSAVMFEYENLGDYYKAEQIMQSRMDIDETMDWLLSEKKYFDKHSEIASNKFENTIYALFDCWNKQGEKLEKNKKVQQQGFLREHYIEYLMNSDMNYHDVLDKLEVLDPEIKRELKMARQLKDLSEEDVMQIHTHLKKYEPIGKRDLVWTNYINDLFLHYQETIIGILPCESDNSLPVDEFEKLFMIRLCWMLTTSHPKYRALLVRKIRKLLTIHPEMILRLLPLFYDANDPYILQGLYCAIAGVLLPSRDKKLLTDVATFIYQNCYEKKEMVPQDLIIRQWTLKIVERAYYIDKNCDFWTKIKTPFRATPFNPDEIPSIDNINSDYFGIQHGSQLLYNSIFGFSDFNRYTIGTNTRQNSSDYFKYNEIAGTYLGDDLDREKMEISYYIMNLYGWNDKLGFLDNGKYSSTRFQNDTERIGKKYQWLAWYRMNARLMDSCRVPKNRYHYSDKAKEDELTESPYPWDTSNASSFDPTLDVNIYKSLPIRLSVLGELNIVDEEDANWINNNDIVPTFRFCAKDDDNQLFIMLYGFDLVKQNQREFAVISNTAFVKASNVTKFKEWCKRQNFYGRWMPERTGSIDFLWNDYPWAGSYKSSVIEVPVWERPPEDCPCDVMLSYAAQLQEHWEGIEYEERYLSTVYMPCQEMMEQEKMYCSEVRGIIKSEHDDKIIAVNLSNENGMTGLFVRKDVLDDYLMKNNYTLFYYVLGEKVHRLGEMNAVMKDISAAYQYNPNSPTGEIITIQPIRVVE